MLDVDMTIPVTNKSLEDTKMKLKVIFAEKLEAAAYSET